MGKTFTGGERNNRKGGGRSKKENWDGDSDYRSPFPPAATAPVRPPRPAPPVVQQRNAPGYRTEDRTKATLTREVRSAGKIIYIDAIHNDKGRAVRITEVSKGERLFVIIPESITSDFRDALNEVIDASLNP